MRNKFTPVVERDGEWFIATCPGLPGAIGKGRTRKAALASHVEAITPEDDPAIAEVRAVRHRISAEHGHDPARLVAHYMELQKQLVDRLIYPVDSEKAP
jgi:hypothetical protein